MAVFTNVENVAHGLTPIAGVKSVSYDRTVTPIMSMADGARGNTIVGDGANEITVTIEVESQGDELQALIGLANKASLTFDVQQAGDSGATSTVTITDVVFLGTSVSTDQANPNGLTLTGQTEAPADTITIA